MEKGSFGVPKNVKRERPAARNGFFAMQDDFERR